MNIYNQEGKQRERGGGDVRQRRSEELEEKREGGRQEGLNNTQ